MSNKLDTLVANNSSFPHKLKLHKEQSIRHFPNTTPPLPLNQTTRSTSRKCIDLEDVENQPILHDVADESPENSAMLKILLCKIFLESTNDISFILYGLNRTTKKKILREIVIQ